MGCLGHQYPGVIEVADACPIGFKLAQGRGQRLGDATADKTDKVGLIRGAHGNKPLNFTGE